MSRTVRAQYDPIHISLIITRIQILLLKASQGLSYKLVCDSYSLICSLYLNTFLDHLSRCFLIFKIL